MAVDLPLLSLLIWVPILGGALALAAGNDRPNQARWVALLAALLTLALSVELYIGFDPLPGTMQFLERHP